MRKKSELLGLMAKQQTLRNVQMIRQLNADHEAQRRAAGLHTRLRDILNDSAQEQHLSAAQFRQNSQLNARIAQQAVTQSEIVQDLDAVVQQRRAEVQARSHRAKVLDHAMRREKISAQNEAEARAENLNAPRR